MFGLAARHAAAVVVAALIVTGLLAVPLLTMTPDEFASQEPGGAAFAARDAIEERFGGDVVTWFFVVEAADGDLLDRHGLLALAERVDALRTDPAHAPLLVSRTDPVTGEEVAGTLSVTDSLDDALRQVGAGGLADADESTLRTVLANVIDEQGPASLGLSAQATRDPDTGWWRAPAITLSVLADGSLIEGRSDAGFGADVGVEEAGRRVQTLLRDADALDVWGIALDQSLTAGEQGEAAGPFIGFTVLVIVLLVGVAFRSYWTLAVVGGALAALLVWLQGLANLIGLKEDQILSTVVPIAMIAFGVDYAFHAVGRYREERAGSAAPRPALTRGLAAVAPALALAFATGAFAFLANIAGGIESITQFGIAAALGLGAALVVLGLVVPLAVGLIDERVAGRTWRWSRAASVAGGVGAASAAMAAVLLIVFLSPPAGLALLAGYLIVFIVVPVWVAGRRPPVNAAPVLTAAAGDGRLASGLSRVVAGVAARRAVVLPTVGLLTAVAAVYAVQVPVSFDVEDFFSPETDFVVALDKLDEHVGDQSGEPADVYIAADFDDPAAVAAVADFAGRVAALDTRLLAHDDTGAVRVDRRALEVLEGDTAHTPAEVAQVLAPANGDGLEAARLGVGLVGSRAQENVEATRDLLEPLVTDLAADLAALHPDADAVLTGTPIVRQASLDAISRSLQVSVPVAVLLCLLCAWAFMRSLRYAVVSLVPILLVIAWLYGFMYVAGFSINLVTATIGAISIGVGIDFAIHMTMRFREELAGQATRLDALRAATAGTGVALVGSTVSSAAGFLVLALAPMPMFASYGLLTAVMISLALVASLLVLPGLLMLVTREPQPRPAGTGTPLAPHPAATAPARSR